MLRALKRRVAIAIAASLLAFSAPLSSAVPAEAATAADVSIGDIVALTIYLPINNLAGAEAATRALQTPGNASYHRFLTVPQFVSSYGATAAQINSLASTLAALGFTVQYIFPNHLAVEAVSSAATAENTFGVKLKHVTVNGRRGIASITPVQIPASLSGMILGVGGFNTITHPRPHRLTAKFKPHVPRASPGALVGGTPGNYLPADFEKFYDVTPLYRPGNTGRGSTIGIVTLNDFKPSDAYLFWKQIGLNVAQTRITKVNVDGGVTAPTNNPDGEGETDLDVEQSGAIAPGALIRVYIAPNISDANFINAFEAAASENLADTISSSWGEAELDYFYNVATQTASLGFLLQAFHAAFLEMALQGQTVYIASGDSGSFATVDECPFYGTPGPSAPTCSAPYAVDHPSADPLVTAAGGTTVPYSYTVEGGVTLSIKQERAWGWHYLVDQFAAQGAGALLPSSAVFSLGDGGGVSSYFAEPWYQLGTIGITRTKAGQVFSQNVGTGLVPQVPLPANFAGRNLPDISTNADPQSGYQLVQDGVAYNFMGGTSFVAPQLNGVTALFLQALGGRVGQINPAIYELGNPTTTNLSRGDNWGYSARGGFSNAGGLGTLDAAKLLVGLFALEYGQASPAFLRAKLLYAKPAVLK
jgi:kumamolisin